ncbi:acyltransferase [Sphingomonas sp.]|jgi:peptidoglycan/LPS O-acetylase OafA/YrhL|uniref:acyltransferase family protein n=1 Tax=Sphingomonas sp. TaxID=28214 RepID=UPI002D7F434A|nr:acyltransferase [Sphingomonas sp.]HEU0043390.1 acyltransferase [Sphingomonas sp.]
MSELRQLTGARGLAAWAVVLYHLRLSIPGLPEPVGQALAKGYLAVDFFFLLSGFVIWLAWHDRVGGETWRFWQKRIARIWPLHLAMLGFAILLAVALTLRGTPDRAFPWGELPLHLLLVQQWGTTSDLHWNDPAWSISAELAAYLLFPLLVRCVDWRRWSTLALVAAAAALLAILPLAMGLGTLGHDITRFGLLRCLVEFATGTILAALYLRRGTARAPLAIAILLLTTAMLGAPETLVVPAGFAALLLALARSRAAALAGWPLHWLGEISYATYLSHFLLWKAVKLLLPPGPAPAIVIAAYLLLVLLASHLLYRGLELPAQRWLNARPFPRRNDASTRALPAHEDRLLR